VRTDSCSTVPVSAATVTTSPTWIAFSEQARTLPVMTSLHQLLCAETDRDPDDSRAGEQRADVHADLTQRGQADDGEDCR